MKLNAKSEYALRAMVDLARRPDDQTTLDEIAARQHIPATILPNIIQALARAGLAQTVRGYGGGVRLGAPADEISVRMILEAIEGPLRVYRCDSGKGPCPLGLGRGCPLRGLWDETQSRVLDLWANTTLADLANARRPRARRKGRARAAAPEPAR